MSDTGVFVRGSAGFTLIEMIVVMSIISALLLVMLPVLSSVLGVDQRKAAQELSATLRYVYDESVVQNAPMRIAYDLDHNRWWVEVADGPVRIFRDRGEKEAFDEFLADKAESDADVAEKSERERQNIPTMSELFSQLGPSDDEGGGGGAGMMGAIFGGGGMAPGARGGEYKPNEFHPLGDEEDDFAARELPGDVRFWGVWTPQSGDEVVKPMDEYELAAMRDTPAEEQKWTVVYTHIFPGGYMEDTVVYLSNPEGDDITSIVVEPLTGRVRVIKGLEDLPDLRDREQR